MNAQQPHPSVEHFRFGPESRLLDDLFSRFGLEQLIEHEVSSGNLVPIHRLLTARGLRLTPITSPRLTGLAQRVAEDIGFPERVDLYVYPAHEIQAVAFHRLADDEAHIVQVSSASIESMDDNELRFVLGHELGHLAFRHYRVMALQMLMSASNEDAGGRENREARVPQLLERRLDRWGRLAEFSADRVGYVAAGRDLGTAVSAFFRMASGLGPEHLRFDLAALLEQVEHLASLDRLEVLARFSHPATPVRARALQLYGAAGASPSSEAVSGVDAEVDRLSRLMEFEVSTELGVHARDFLISAGLLAANADGEVTEREQEIVVRLLLQVTGDPEGHLDSVTSTEQAESMLEKSCAWLRENTGQERLSLFGQIVNVVAVDGSIERGEQQFLDRLSEMLGIPARSAKEIAHEVLSGYIKSIIRSLLF